MQIILPLQKIREYYDKQKLVKIENELTDEDYEWYNTQGWKNYRPEYHIDYLLPSLGEPLYIGHDTPAPVVEINGKRYAVKIKSDYNYHPYEAAGKKLILTETEEPLSEASAVKINCIYQFFGQPWWIQGPCYPAHNGQPCSHFVTVNNCWGDNGNWNILIACDEDGVPIVAYFEASCH